MTATTAKIEKYTEIFKALASPQRLKIFLSLAECGSKGLACNSDSYGCECVSVLGKGTGLTLATVSHHIKELKRAGLIKTRRNGQHIECWVEKGCLNEIAEVMKSI